MGIIIIRINIDVNGIGFELNYLVPKLRFKGTELKGGQLQFWSELINRSNTTLQ